MKEVQIKQKRQAKTACAVKYAVVVDKNGVEADDDWCRAGKESRSERFA
jgi:hypothetical protein